MGIVGAKLAWTVGAAGGDVFRGVLEPTHITWPTMVIGLVASLPVMAAGLVALTGIAGLQTDPRLARAALVEPSFALPLAAVWGAVGGQIGRRVSDIRGRFARRHAQARGA